MNEPPASGLPGDPRCRQATRERVSAPATSLRLERQVTMFARSRWVDRLTTG